MKEKEYTEKESVKIILELIGRIDLLKVEREALSSRQSALHKEEEDILHGIDDVFRMARESDSPSLGYSSQGRVGFIRFVSGDTLFEIRQDGGYELDIHSRISIRKTKIFVA